jgi:hypothetical protein
MPAKIPTGTERDQDNWKLPVVASAAAPNHKNAATAPALAIDQPYALSENVRLNLFCIYAL